MTKSRSKAVITGATSGIGAAFARALAARGLDLIITGRRREKIQNLAEEIRVKNGVNVEVILADLGIEKDLAALEKRVRSCGELEFLVNNAGFATMGFFHEETLDASLAMLHVHCQTSMALTRAALKLFLPKRSGAIIQVSSLAAFVPFPGNAMYAATKSFLNVFTEALALEHRHSGIRFQALCPGMTRTDFHERMRLRPEEVYKKFGPMKAMSAEEVAAFSLERLGRDVICVPGLHNRINLFLAETLPRKIRYRVLLLGTRRISSVLHPKKRMP